MDPITLATIGGTIAHSALDGTLGAAISGIIEKGYKTFASCSGILQDHEPGSGKNMSTTPYIGIANQSDNQRYNLIAAVERAFPDDRRPFLFHRSYNKSGIYFPVDREQPGLIQAAELELITAKFLHYLAPANEIAKKLRWSPTHQNLRFDPTLGKIVPSTLQDLGLAHIGGEWTPLDHAIFPSISLVNRPPLLDAGISSTILHSLREKGWTVVEALSLDPKIWDEQDLENAKIAGLPTDRSRLTLLADRYTDQRDNIIATTEAIETPLVTYTRGLANSPTSRNLGLDVVTIGFPYTNRAAAAMERFVDALPPASAEITRALSEYRQCHLVLTDGNRYREQSPRIPEKQHPLGNLTTFDRNVRPEHSGSERM